MQQQQNYNSVDEESSLLGTSAVSVAAPAATASASKITIAAVSALVLFGLGAVITTSQSGAAFTASTNLKSALGSVLKASSTDLASNPSIFQNNQGSWMDTGRSNWNNNNGVVFQLGNNMWVGDACWHNNEAMTGLEYKNDGSNFYWRYQCSGALVANGAWNPVNFKQGGPGSGSSQWANGHIEYLDRQHLFCPGYSYLNGFKFERDGGNLKTFFNCINYWNQANYYQEDYYTGFNDRGGINFLDRHSLKCPGGTAMSGFEGITGNDQRNNVVRGSIPGNGNGKFQFHYICASATVLNVPSPTPLPTFRPISDPTVAPSPAPVTDPTLKPISLPTTAPSPNPVAEPTLKPISLPTTAPSPVPIANPTAAPQRLKIFQDNQGSWVNTGKSNWNNNNGAVIQLGSGQWVGDACWNNNEAMSGLEYKNDGNDFYWRYQCTGPLVQNGAGNPVNFKSAGPGSGSSQWSGGIEYLDRQRAFCPSYSYLNGFKFDKDGGNLKLTFNCINYWNQNSYSQQDYYSGWNDRGGINFLDRHSLKCPGGTAISGFEGITSTDQRNNVVSGSIPSKPNGDKFQFHYICATAIVLAFPSPAPTPLPTLVPISKPTAAPSPVPISDPTESPISHPTAAPSPVPISDPTLAPISAPTDSPISEPTESPVADPTASPVAGDVADQSGDESEVDDKIQIYSGGSLGGGDVPDDTSDESGSDQSGDESEVDDKIKNYSGGSLGGATDESGSDDKAGASDAGGDAYKGKSGGHSGDEDEVDDKIKNYSGGSMGGGDVPDDSSDESGPSGGDTSSKIRPFVFTKGVSPDVPPAGVVLLADKDINFLKHGQISNAAYVVGPATGINGELLSSAALLDKVSTIVPGASTKATFYSGDNLDGLEYTFNPRFFQALTSFHYHGSKAGGNDHANSVFVSSTIDADLPDVARRAKILKV